jgi:hypothetical protein
MALANTARLETFARLIALGHPPVLAAKAAGYRTLRASRAATRLAPRPAAGGAKRTRRAAAAAKESKGAGAAQAARPPLAPMMTEAEWLATFAPMARGDTGAHA